MVVRCTVIGGKQPMERIRKWVAAGVLVLLPVQTHWLLRAAAWEFGSARLLVMECVVLVLSLCFVRTWWKMRTVRVRRATVFAVAGMVLWGVGVSQGSVIAVLQLVHMLSAGALGIILWESVRHWGVLWVLSWYLAGGVVWAGMGIVQWIQQVVTPSTWMGMAAHAPAVAGDSVVLMEGVRVLRAYGPMPHPNIFGGLMVSYVYAAILLIRSGGFQGWWRRSMVLGVMSLCVAALVLSFSRSAWIAAVVVLLVAVPWRRAWRLWIRLAVVPVGVMLVVAVFVAPAILTRVQGTNVLETRSQSERADLWRDGMRLVQANPYFGTGLGLATTGIQRLDPSREAWTLQPPHFVPLLIAVELGIVGVLLVLLCGTALPWNRGLFVLIPGLIFDHFYWSLPAGLFLLTVLWFLTTIQAKLALDQ